MPLKFDRTHRFFCSGESTKIFNRKSGYHFRMEKIHLLEILWLPLTADVMPD